MAAIVGPDPLSPACARGSRMNNQRSATEIDYGIHYRVWHDDSAEHAAVMASLLGPQLQPYLPCDREARCLDIGCGMGFAIQALQDVGFKNVRGIDIDRSQVDAAVRRGLPVEQVDDTPSYLAAHPSAFDVILLLDVLEHIPVGEELPALRAAYGALRPGGRIIVQVPNANAACSARWRYIDFTHANSFTEHSLAFVLANAGFVEISVPRQPDPSFPPPPWRIWRRSHWLTFGRRLRQWAMRKLWRQMCIAELGTGRGADNISLSLNIVGIGYKPG